MKIPDQAKAVRFHDVGFSTEDITLFSRNSKLSFVAKKDIRHITLKYGFQSERPLVEVLFGIAMAGAGFYLIANIILKGIIHQVIYVEELLSLLLLPVGSWFIMDGLRKRIYFEVEMDSDKRKFPLRKDPDKNELRKFIGMASRLGYVIDDGLMEKLT